MLPEGDTARHSICQQLPFDSFLCLSFQHPGLLAPIFAEIHGGAACDLRQLPGGKPRMKALPWRLQRLRAQFTNVPLQAGFVSGEQK